MVLQSIGFYTSWLAEKMGEYKDQRGGTPSPANKPNTNQNHTDNYLFMTPRSLKMTVMDWDQ